MIERLQPKGEPVIDNIIEHTDEIDMYGMRLSHATTDKSDSCYDNEIKNTLIGNKDLRLIKSLLRSGSERKILRNFIIKARVLMPLKWWKHLDTYKVGTNTLSSSTMHNLTDRKLTIDDFSNYFIKNFSGYVNVGINYDHTMKNPWDTFIDTINTINTIIMIYKREKKTAMRDGLEAMIFDMLPDSYLQERVLCFNYEVLFRMYNDRKKHKLKEWHFFLDTFINELAYFKYFIGD